MQYNNMKTGIFIERPNRFIAYVMIEGKLEKCHVKNTGRCKELLIEGVEVYVECHNDPKRKTQFSLIGVKKGNTLINMDSQAPNKVVMEWLKAGNLYPNPTFLKGEKTYGQSRFDFYMEQLDRKCYIEVKGVTLEENGVAMFPDAPTERGVKHILELCKCIEDGYEAYIIFVIQMKGIKEFRPNTIRQPEFHQALIEANKKGVKILAYDCIVTKNSLIIDQEIPISL